jgi:hypothetical protein
MTWMSESGRVRPHRIGPKEREPLAVRLVARGVHVLCGVVFAGCVIPPPLTVEQDGGVNAPPSITAVLDTSGTSRRAPDTITLPQGSTAEITVTLTEIDHSDDVFVQIFRDYDVVNPLPPLVHCGAPADPSAIRVAHCTTAQLCPDVGGPRTLEIEAYDRTPNPNTPYREGAPGEFFSTWTFQLECVAPS